MKKGQISNFLRKLRLLYFTDFMRFYFQKLKNRKINKTFVKNHPEVSLPPDYLMYESFQINYRKYYTDSIGTANKLIEYFKKYTDLKNKNILDWGCGPGRIIRHFPELINNGCVFYGTDYNKKSIEWCRKNLPGISFNINSLQAKLPYENESMDIIYGISIFTHLSEQMHYDWYNELYRILKPEGIMLLTTQGNNFKVKLTKEEIKNFNNHQLIVRGMVKEGHRTYSAFQPAGFMKELFKNVTVLEHLEPMPEDKKSLPQQDIWIIRKQQGL